MSKNGNGNRGGRIITGPGNEVADDPQTMDEMPPLPRLRTFRVTWFNPEKNKIEPVLIEAHEFGFPNDGALIFTALRHDIDPAAQAAGLSPISRYVVESFGSYIRFNEVILEGSVQ